MQFSIRLLILFTSVVASLLIAAKSFSALGLLLICPILPLLSAQYVRYVEKWTEPSVGLFLWLISVSEVTFLAAAIYLQEQAREEIHTGDLVASLAGGVTLGMGLAALNMLLDLLITATIRGPRNK